MKWFEATNMPPARGDLAENPAFKDVIARTPGLEAYAKAVPTAVPPMAHPNFEELHRLIGEQALAPVVQGQKNPEQAWQDLRRAIEEAIR